MGTMHSINAALCPLRIDLIAYLHPFNTSADRYQYQHDHE